MLHRLTYFTVNLSDEYLKQDPQFMTYVNGRNGVVSLFKAKIGRAHV